MDMNQHEHEFLTGAWDGPKGAAFNQVYEFCRGFGWCDSQGQVTEKGRQAISEYESKIN